MPSLKKTATALLSTTLIVLANCQLSAFEQGTYFIYQLVEKSDTKVINKRLALDSALFTQTNTKQAKTEVEAVKRSEFEMDYNSFGTGSASSSFEDTQSTKTPAPAKSDTSLFDIGTEETISLFGD